MKPKNPRNRCLDGSRYRPLPKAKYRLFAAFREKREEFTGPQLQLRGGRILDVEDCQGVRICSDSIIRLELPGFLLTILGSGLSAQDFSASTLTIRGNIRSLELDALPRKKGGASD